MFKILISDKLGKAGTDLLDTINDVNYDLRPGLSAQELQSIIGDYDGLIIRSATQADEALLEAAGNLKVIGRAGVGVDNVDLQAATGRGIIVMNTPQANSIATAEHAMTMMLAISRHTAAADAVVRQGKWDKSKFTGVQLYRKTLGLIGFGQIARIVAKYARGFDMQVIAYDPFVGENIANEHQVKLVNLDELMATSDYVSLHTVSTPQTHNIINATSLSLTKPTAIIINSARGSLIDEQALADALNSGRIKAAAVDVYKTEPPGTDHPLIGLDNVLHLPHLGASTQEAQRDVATQIVEQVVDALRQDDFRNSVNMPFATGPDFKRILPYVSLAEKIGALHSHMADHPIRKVEIEISGKDSGKLVKPIACGVLKGILDQVHAGAVNYISAPSLADKHGIKISQTQTEHKSDYSVLVRVTCEIEQYGKRVIAGALFDTHPRIVQVNDYHLDLDPEGTIMIMLNHDRPGVIGQVGTILAKNHINIAQWRLGRTEKGAQALAFINLDSEPEAAVLDEILANEAVIKAKVITL